MYAHAFYSKNPPVLQMLGGFLFYYFVTLTSCNRFILSVKVYFYGLFIRVFFKTLKE